ncbi:MAG: NuoM family protein [Vulcanimicrobiota bacterium]
MNDWPVLSVITLLPLLAATLIMLLPEKAEQAVRALALGSTGLAGLFSVWLFVDYSHAPTAGFTYIEEMAWLPRLGISYKLGADGLSVPMILLTGIIGFTAMLMSGDPQRTRQREYYALALAAISGVYGVFCSLDLFFFVLFYELASIPMFFLVGIWGSDKSGDGRNINRQAAAMKLLLYLQLGGGLVLLGILGLYFGSGADTFDFTKIAEASFSAGWQKFLFFLLFLGFGIEAGLVPFHTWLPDGHSSAPTALSMLLAGVLLKMGGYGILRLGVQLLPEGTQHWMHVFVVMAVVNILYGGLCALRQTDVKVMIAYSSVSHMGMVFLGVACVNSVGQAHVLYGLSGAVFQMFSHGIITALLFALAGTIYEITHVRNLKSWGGLAVQMPFFACLYVFAAMASLGLPGMTGFVAELMVLIGIWQFNPTIACFAILGLVITTTYLLRSVQFGFYGPLNPKHTEARDANLREQVATLTLAATTLFFGLLPGVMVAVMNPTLLEISKGYI